MGPAGAVKLKADHDGGADHLVGTVDVRDSRRFRGSNPNRSRVRVAAAIACEFLGPKMVMPMHYGALPPLAGTPEQLRQLLGSSPPVEVLSPVRVRRSPGSCGNEAGS